MGEVAAVGGQPRLQVALEGQEQFGRLGAVRAWSSRA
jgi:hypothetical protein